MKKFSVHLITLIVLSFTINVSAQFQIGPIGGVNLANITLDPTEAGTDFNTKIGFAGGVMMVYNFSPIFALLIEPAYMQKGSSVKSSFTDEGNNFTADQTISANYIDVPLLFRASFGNGNVKPYLLAGGSVGYLFGDAKLKIDKITMNGNDVTSQFPSDRREQTLLIKSLDIGLNFGAGVSFLLKSVILFLEGQYNIGLTDINDDPTDNAKAKTKGIQIKAGVLFEI